jgi:hypothetical protein
MKQITGIILLLALITGCGNRKGRPDVSGIKVDIKIERFEDAFFGMDTANVMTGWQQLQQQFPGFSDIFAEKIIGAGKVNDTNKILLPATLSFLHDVRPLYDTMREKFKRTDAIETALEEGFRLMKYYFPDFKVPKVITYVGLIGDAGASIIPPNGVAIGLQMYGGKDFASYEAAAAQAIIPAYISRRFEPAYIPVNVFQAVIDDVFPDKSGSKPLIEQMIEKGKRLYLLDHILPETADSLKIGYTQLQLKDCYANEQLIWNLFLRNNYLYSIDPDVLKKFVEESPKIDELGDGAPGYIGLFTGWQIVKKYMEKKPDTKLSDLMAMDPKIIFEESKYNPR